MPRQVIVVTDGDTLAKRALKMAAKQIGARVITRSGGNPTLLTGFEIARYVKQAKYDPVIVMFDDNGSAGEASGEKALRELMNDPEIDVIGALAVASNTTYVGGVDVDFSIDCEGRRVESGVNKDGIAVSPHFVRGDTVDILQQLRLPVVVGVGDLGKMGGRDAPARASPVTTIALRSILDARAHASNGHRT